MRLISVVLLVFLLTTSAWAGTLKDDFSDGDFDGWMQSGRGHWRVENKELVFDNLDYPSVLFVGEPDWRDYTISVRAKLITHQPTNCCGEGIMLAARGKSVSNAYLFLLGTWQQTGKQVLGCYTQGNVAPNSMKTNPFQWEMSSWYDLRLTVHGDKCVFYVDNKRVLTYEDKTYELGRVGIGGAFNTTTIHFDDVIISGDDVPDMNLSVAPKTKLTTTWSKLKGAIP